MRAFIVAEIASNWEGSVSVAKKLIKESKKAGADAVKFQMWRASDLYQGHPDWKIIKKSELTFAKVKTLKTYSDKLGIEFFCSGFYPESIEYLQSLPDFYMEIDWNVSSWIPLVSSLAPSDTFQIWKKGGSIR